MRVFWIFASLSLAAIPVAGAQAQDFMVVQDINEKRPKVLLAITVWGEEGSLRRLSAVATVAGLANERCDEDSRRGLMIAMLPGPKKGARGRLYRDTVAGKYGQLEVEVAVLGVSEMRRGDGLDAGTAQSPDTITSPVD